MCVYNVGGTSKENDNFTKQNLEEKVQLGPTKPLLAHMYFKTLNVFLSNLIKWTFMSLKYYRTDFRKPLQGHGQEK